MATKKKAAAKATATAPKSTVDTRQRRGARPGDPSYQAPAFASEEELAVLSEGPEARRKAVLDDIKRMHAEQG